MVEGSWLIWEGYIYIFWFFDVGGVFCVYVVYWLFINFFVFVNVFWVDFCWFFKFKLSMSVSDFDIVSLSIIFVIVDWENKRLFMIDLIFKLLWVFCFWSIFYLDINFLVFGICFGLSY